MEEVIIITGASRGIGREIAKTLAKNGKKVIANYNHSLNQAVELQEELKKEGIEIDLFRADVSKKQEAEKLVEFTIKKYKKIDVLINNAGISDGKMITDITDEDWHKMINTNLYSAFIMSQLAIPYMIHEKQGQIINISSIWGMVGSSCEVLYSITKAGMNGLTKALAKELGPSGIRVNAIAPGMINTEMNNEFSPEEIEAIKQEIPLEKIGEPNEIAKCVKWLLEDSYTTGQIISINGGWVIT
jgi:3-oxoacyl-[acyl-carrier protein] reductase